MQFSYHRDGGDLVYSIDGKAQFRAEEIALAYTEHDDENDLVTLHKHGPLDKVQEWYDSNRDKFCQIGYPLKLISSSAWTGDDLDHFINCTGSLGPWLKKQGLLGDKRSYPYELLQPAGIGAGSDGRADQESVPG